MRYIFVVTALILTLLCNTASASLYTVKKDGTGNYTSLKSAIAIASMGDTIEIQDNSTYAENLSIEKSITIQAGEVYKPTILCSGSPVIDYAYILLMYYGGAYKPIIFKGIIIKSDNTPKADTFLIYCPNAYCAELENCTLIGPGGDTTMKAVYGVEKINNTTITGFDYGLCYNRVTDLINIYKCTIQNCNKSGIQLRDSNSNVNISNSIIKKTISGHNIYIGGGETSISNCNISDAGADNVLITSGTVYFIKTILTNPAPNKSNISCEHITEYPYPADVTINHCDIVGSTNQWDVRTSDSYCMLNIKNSILTGENGITNISGKVISDYNDVYCTNPYDKVTTVTNNININPPYIQTNNPDEEDYFMYYSDSPCTTAGESYDYLGSKGNIGKKENDVTLGVYYYPWYYKDFHKKLYIRQYLLPKQEPELGEYNDWNADIIKKHLDWSLYAGVSLWITSWWGEKDLHGNLARENICIKDYILPTMASNSKYKDMRVALHYETAGRVTGLPPYMDTSRVGPDTAYIVDTFFKHPNYFKIDGKPVLVVYSLASYDSTTRRGIIQIMRDTAASKGYQLYIIADLTSGSPVGQLLTDVNDGIFDAITDYSMYGGLSTKGYAGQSQIVDYFAKQSIWKIIANSCTTSDGKKVGFIPDIVPGFNDKAVRGGNYPLSRKLTENDEEGSFFRAALKEARKYTDPNVGNLLFITSWNEWHEDTQIEPVKFLMPPDNVTSKDTSSSGTDYTQSFEYETYGMLYLDILRDEVLKTPCDIPEWRKY